MGTENYVATPTPSLSPSVSDLRHPQIREVDGDGLKGCDGDLVVTLEAMSFRRAWHTLPAPASKVRDVDLLILDEVQLGFVDDPPAARQCTTSHGIILPKSAHRILAEPNPAEPEPRNEVEDFARCRRRNRTDTRLRQRYRKFFDSLFKICGVRN